MARPIAPRFEITVLKDKSSTDKAQVPATDAVINFYRAGATVSAQTPIPAFEEEFPVPIYDPGRLAVNDTVRIAAGPGTLVVSAVTQSQLLLTNNSGSPVTLGPATRLVPTNNRPNVYSDPLGTASIGTFVTVDAVTARASAYLSSDRVDYDVTIPGQPVRLYVDGAGVLGRSDKAWSDLRDYGGNLQAAIDGLPDEGGIVFVPRGTWMLGTGVTINKPSVMVVGEGPGSVLRAATANSYDMITVNQLNFQMRDLTLDGAATSYGVNGKSCLYLRGIGESGNLVLNTQLQNVTITRSPRYGLYMRDVIVFLAEGCHFDSNWGSGARIDWASTNPAGATTTQFTACTFNQNGDRGCEANEVTVLTYLGCAFEGNKGGAGASQGNGLEATSCIRIDVLSSYFKDANAAAQVQQYAYFGSCLSAVVDGCWFERGTVAALGPVQGVLFANSNLSRLSSCTGKDLTSYLATFGSSSFDCVEFGNSETDQSIPRLNMEAQAQRLVGMSRRALSVPYLNEAERPTTSDAVLPGSLVWSQDSDQLQVWNGSEWKIVSLS